MSVIINELELTTEAAPPAESAPAPRPDVTGVPEPISPLDLRDVIDWQETRRRRVAAP